MERAFLFIFNLVSTTRVFWGKVARSMALLQNLDIALLHFIQPHLPLNSAFLLFAVFCAKVLLAFIPLHMLLLWCGAKKREKAELIAVFVTLGVGVCTAFIIGHLYFRTRPFLAGVSHAFIAHRPSASFPSDHAVLFGVYLYFLRAYHYRYAFYVAAICAILTCWARVFVGVHYPSDVVAGLGIGWLIALMCLPLCFKIGEKFSLGVFARKKHRQKRNKKKYKRKK